MLNEKIWVGQEEVAAFLIDFRALECLEQEQG